MTKLLTGNLRKMRVELGKDSAAEYALLAGDATLPLNPLVGESFALRYTGKINCIYCGRKTSKSFNQGYCYPCFKSLARCDSCIVRPEKCHYHLGTCREPEWADSYCMQDHYVYLANSSGIKVGITRGDQVPTRWIDQGASQALPMFRVKSRYIAGLVEVHCKQYVSDKTNWRTMLKGSPDAVDLCQAAAELQGKLVSELDELCSEHGLQAIQQCDAAEQVDIRYPVLQHPQKIVSANFDKEPSVGGRLTGIKGQYLIFEDTVINIRKFSGYEVEVSY